MNDKPNNGKHYGWRVVRITMLHGNRGRLLKALQQRDLRVLRVGLSATHVAVWIETTMSARQVEDVTRAQLMFQGWMNVVQDDNEEA